MHCMSARAILRLSIIALSLLQVSTVSAQQNETRIALVIGNSTYPDADAPFPAPSTTRLR